MYNIAGGSFGKCDIFSLFLISLIEKLQECRELSALPNKSFFSFKITNITEKVLQIEFKPVSPQT